MRAKLDSLSVAAVTVTVIAFSATAPLTAFAAAPALTLAFGRNALGLLTLGPIFMLVRRGEMRRIFQGKRAVFRKEQRRAVWFSFFAGTALAAHFVTFMSGTRMTSVAMATALVATQPVWQAVIATMQKRKLAPTAWIGLGISVAGAAVASGADVRTGSTAVIGDLLALAGAVALAVYTALSEKARPHVSTPMYSVLCFFVCTVELLLLCLVTGTPAVSFTGNTWIALLGLLIFPQLLGLFSLNFALGRAPATAVSVMLLLEAPVAALIAWLWLDQLPAGLAWPGLLMIMMGVAVVVVGDARQPDAAAGDMGGTGVPLTLPQHALLTPDSASAGDVHSLLWREAREGRFEEVEARIAKLEVASIRTHGAKSSEATHWIEVRAVVARIAGKHSLAARLWLSAARFHASSSLSDPVKVRACLDQALHEWGNEKANDAIGALAPALRDMLARYPDHRPEALNAIDERLRRRGLEAAVNSC
ncbi:DMT family transporter [Streptomyces sp. NPDC087844]|uniref:DMT family transporter n=1 Tax=Streptomyces sp. NPDC087844 TaxID=3365805 RepID=UPI00381EE007